MFSRGLMVILHIGHPLEQPKKTSEKGCEDGGSVRRLLPHDFPLWKTLYHDFRAWRIGGTREWLHEVLRTRA